MPVSEKQKGYAKKWDKENLSCFSCRIRKEYAEEFKEWCSIKGVAPTSELKRFVMEEIEKYHEYLDNKE